MTQTKRSHKFADCKVKKSQADPTDNCQQINQLKKRVNNLNALQQQVLVKEDGSTSEGDWIKMEEWLTKVQKETQKVQKQLTLKKVYIANKVLYAIINTGETPSCTDSSNISEPTWREPEKNQGYTGSDLEGRGNNPKLHLLDPEREAHRPHDYQWRLLLGNSKLDDNDYISIFDKDASNVYDATNRHATFTRGSIIGGWRHPHNINTWWVLLVRKVANQNIDTLISKEPPKSFPKSRPPPSQAVFSIYEIHTQL